MHYELSDYEWTAIEPRSGAPWREAHDDRLCPELLTGIAAGSSKIKQCRRIATRDDKLAADYLAFIKLAAIRIWLHAYESARS
jgi:transposase